MTLQVWHLLTCLFFCWLRNIFNQRSHKSKKKNPFLWFPFTLTYKIHWSSFWKSLVGYFSPKPIKLSPLDKYFKSLSQGNFLPIRKEHFGVSQNPFCHQLPLTKDGQRHHFGASILLGCCVMRHSQNSHKNQAKLATHRKSAVCQIGPNFENVK